MTVSPTARRYVHRKRPETLLLEAVVVFRHRVPEDDRWSVSVLTATAVETHSGKGSVLATKAVEHTAAKAASYPASRPASMKALYSGLVQDPARVASGPSAPRYLRRTTREGTTREGTALEKSKTPHREKAAAEHALPDVRLETNETRQQHQWIHSGLRVFCWHSSGPAAQSSIRLKYGRQCR